MDSRPNYDHSQPGTFVLAALGSGAALCAVVLLLVLQDERTPLPAALAAGAVLAVVLGCAVVFRRLRVVVTERAVLASFGSGWPRRTIPLADVRAARAVRNRWWYGWGIRLTPHGWLFNVSGLDAVELDLPEGRKFRIGTDDPRGLVEAIERATGRTGPRAG